MKSVRHFLFVATLSAVTIGFSVAPASANEQESQAKLDARAYEALATHNTKLLEMLRSVGADPARYAKNNRGALFDAVRPERSIDILEFVLKSGADPNITKHEKLSITPIFEARFDREKIWILLKYGADPNFKDSSGYTLLATVLFHQGRELAVMSSSMPEQKPRVYDKVSLVKLLVDHGADLNGNNGGFGQWGALGLARREDKEVIDLLIKRGATLNYDIGGPTLMDYVTAKQRGDSAPSDKVKGPITVAIDGLGRDDLALALLARDGMTGPKDRLALLQATRRGWRDVAAALLRAGADPNAASVDGLTPLAMAERRRDEPLVRMLVAAGAKPSAQTVKPRYEIEGWSEFEKKIANEVDEVALFDPPRFTLNLYLPRKENPFVLYGKKINQYEEVKCERSVGFTIIANAGIAGGISAGVCTQEARRLREYAASAKRGMDMLLDVLIKKGAMKANEGELAKIGWVFDKKTGPKQSDIFYFPVIVIGHGVLDAPTVVLVSKNDDKAIIVQASVMNLCGEGRSIQSQTPLCSDTKSAITDIAQRLFARFGGNELALE